MHYAFDTWMWRHYPHIPFERYADDAVIHCHSEPEAKTLKGVIEERPVNCGLELHRDKIKDCFWMVKGKGPIPS